MYLITNRDVFFNMRYYFAINHFRELCDVDAVPGAKLYNVDVTFVNNKDNFDVDGLYFYGINDDFKRIDAALCKGPSNNFSYSSVYQHTCCEEIHTLTHLQDDVGSLAAALWLGANLSLTQEQQRALSPVPHVERTWTVLEQRTPPENDPLPNNPHGLREKVQSIITGMMARQQSGNDRLGLGGVMTDLQITTAVLEHDMIKPFFMDTVREHEGQPVISYGLGTMGYDTRLRPIFKLFKKDPANGVIDPKAFDERHVTVVEGDVIELPPKTYALSETVECFNMPDDVMAFCLAKSTYARCCIGVNTTPIWPGFKGHVVIEFYNHGDVPVKIYANEGFAQFVFIRASETVKHNYADRGGVYHGQETGVQSAKVGKK